MSSYTIVSPKTFSRISGSKLYKYYWQPPKSKRQYKLPLKQDPLCPDGTLYFFFRGKYVGTARI